MDFELTEEQRMVRDMVREFAQKEIAPKAGYYDEEGKFPLEIIRKMGELGLMGIEVPEKYGGQGLDTISYVLAMEEVAKADVATSTIMTVNNSLFAYGLLDYGTEEQKMRYLKPVATGEKIGAYALTEPSSGSDAANMRTIAKLDSSGRFYVLNGRKSWITGGPVADIFILFAMTEPEKRHHGVTAFIIEPGDDPGFIRGKKEPKLGIRGSDTSEIVLEDLKVPVENVLGEPGQGFKIAMHVLDGGRIGIASQALGVAEAAFEMSRQYVQERRAFGKPIGQFEGIAWYIADMATRIEASRMLIYQAAMAKERSKTTGERYTMQAAMAKLFASETAMWVTTKAIQIHGGMGYSKELPLERYFRDAKITEIYEGTSEIQRLVIARLLTGLRVGA